MSIIEAIKSGDIKLVRELLLNGGVNVNQKDENGDTLLHAALMNESKGRALDIAQLLVYDYGADYNIENKNNETAIDIAIRSTHKSMQALLMVDAIVNDNEKAVQRFIDAGGNVDGYYCFCDDLGGRLINLAARYNRVNIVQNLIDNNAIVDGVFHDESDDESDDDNDISEDRILTPLFYAIHYGHLEVVKLFIRHNPDVINIQFDTGFTPMSIAEHCGNLELGKLFIANGADFDNVDSNFYKEVINNIAHEEIEYSIEYSKYTEKKLALAMSSNERLGKESSISVIEQDMMEKIMGIDAPLKIELDKMKQQHHAAVQQRIEKLRQEEIQQKKDTPGNSVGANDVMLISPTSLQNRTVANPI